MLALAPLSHGFLVQSGLDSVVCRAGSLGAFVMLTQDPPSEKITFDQALMIRRRTPGVAALLGAARASTATVNPIYPEKQLALFPFLKNCLWLSEEILAKVENACSKVTYSSPPEADVFLSLCPNEVPGLSLELHMRPDGESDLVVTPQSYLPDGSGLDPETGAPDAAMLRARLSCLAAGRSGKPPQVGVHIIDFSSLFLSEPSDRKAVTCEAEAAARVAAALSRAIRQNTRISDFMGRAGPRQFCVIQAETETEAALFALRRRLATKLPASYPWDDGVKEEEIRPISISSYLFAGLPKLVRNALCALETLPSVEEVSPDHRIAR